MARAAQYHGQEADHLGCRKSVIVYISSGYVQPHCVNTPVSVYVVNVLRHTDELNDHTDQLNAASAPGAPLSAARRAERPPQLTIERVAPKAKPSEDVACVTGGRDDA